MKIMSHSFCLLTLLSISLGVTSTYAQANVTIEQNDRRASSADFKFDSIAAPSKNDAGVIATFELIAGRADGNGASTRALQDGELPTDRDQPAKNWFLAGQEPGRLLVDFGKPIELREIRSYSWHPSSRAHQVYDVLVPKISFADENEVRSIAGSDDWQSGWNEIASIDSRKEGADRNAQATQVAVSIKGKGEDFIAKTRYVLFKIRPTAENEVNCQTFFSEIDFLDGNRYEPPAAPEKLVDVLIIPDVATIRFDTTEMPALRSWVTQTLMPACQQWYPRIVQALPSDGFTAPRDFKIVFQSDMRGVAYTRGKDVFCAGSWYTRNLEGEATGSVIHELVHVVQQYGRRGGARPPGWLVEGIADHIRWYQFEPKGKKRIVNWERSNYDDAYFPSATFLDYIVRNIDQDAIRKINADAREGKLRDGYFVNQYGKTADEIWQAAKQEAKQNVTAGNPVFEGWYADPEALVFGDRYWIYPTTSDRYEKQLHFDAFSSPDLVNWTKHPRILDNKEISWAWRAMWAPSAIEKDGKYYFFFGANDIQNDESPGGIGVAVADNPAGPFKDHLGKPLIDKFVNGAQPIDQYVFKDGDSHYIVYGGWKHCNIAKLNDEFTGIIPFEDGSTFREITPDGYVEGPIMFRRQGKLYFMWSEGGWTGPNYRVAYAAADSPLGPFERVGTILQQDPAVATGAGHHSVINVPGTDHWFIVYHRRPLGRTDRDHRVTCIDKMEFDDQGRILPVKITFEGVSPHPIKK